MSSLPFTYEMASSSNASKEGALGVLLGMLLDEVPHQN